MTWALCLLYQTIGSNSLLIDWLNSYDKSDSPDWNQAQLVNWYLIANKRGKLPLAAFPTPGTTLWSAGAGSVGRGGIKYNSIAYVVIDNKFYSVGSDGTKTERGTLNTSTGRVRFAKITDQIIMIDGTNGYHYVPSTTTFTTITDVDFPDTATSITAMDEYFLVTQPSSPIITYSDISDGLSYNALNIFQKNRIAENAIGVKAIHGQIMVCGETSIEPYFNSGAPFERSQDSILNIGISNIDTLCASSDSSLYGLAEQEGGGYMIVQARQDQFGEVSENIRDDLNALTTISDAFAYIYKQKMHEFYVITFPTDAKTFVYDITTQSWHERQSYIGSAYTRHISNFCISCYNKIIIGDYQSGNLYTMDTEVYTEADTPIRRKLRTYPFYSEGKYITGHKLEVLFESGVGADSDVDVYFSKDDGHTFTAFSPTRDIGASYGVRSLLFDRLGSSRSWQFEVITTTVNKAIMLGAVGDFAVSEW